MDRGGGVGAWADLLGTQAHTRDAAVVAYEDHVRVEQSGLVVVVAPFAPDLAPTVRRWIASGDTGVVLVGHPDAAHFKEILRSGLCTVLPEGADPETLALAVRAVLERLAHPVELARVRTELGHLVQIARAITQERDLGRLLGLILSQSRSITGADAGSIYVVEGDVLRFKLSQNDSVSFRSEEFTMPVSRGSIAGAAVLGRAPIVIDDVGDLGPDAPYAFDPSFDERVGYRTRSMITAPMVSAEKDVIGVIQLINRKRDPAKPLAPDNIVPFDARCREVLVTLASQAGIALENALLYDEIRSIFEGFVRASVQAIEQRDPTTSGHSLRVSLLALRLSDVVDRSATGPYREVRFTARDRTELEYASLLHDFGKIGVREQVLVKANKLYPHELDAIAQRLEIAAAQVEIDLVREALEAARRGSAPSSDALERRIADRRAVLSSAWDVIVEANAPSVLHEDKSGRLVEIAAIWYRGPEGRLRPLLEPQELAALQVPRGSLTPREFDEIRAHVSHTIAFLNRIPWGRSLAGVPAVAGAHHERLDGSGYPYGLVAAQIPVASKVMSVADIYDALTASDRPYKRAIPHERALAILDAEARDGHLCGDLVRMFREGEVYRVLDA